ncbi:MAG: sulfatase-like hydrolase/transferase [Lacipirellulaceae bacterium]
MRFHAFGLITAVLCSYCSTVASFAQPPKPNVIFILADDVGIGDIGTYGQQTIPTPNLDQMAAEGIKYSQMYSGASVCSPSRAVLMTGLHNGRFNNGNGVNLRDSNVTVAETLKSAGYQTAAFGKWHLGGSGASLPARQGFDEYFGILGAVDSWDHYQPNLQRNTSASPSTVIPVANNFDNGNPRYTGDLFTDEASQYIRAKAQTGQPFYTQLNLQLAHFDLEVPELEPFTEGQSWPLARKIYGSMITRLDRMVGDVLNAVDDPNNDGDTSDSIAANTLIVFASDNGTHIEPAACCKGNHGPNLGVFSDDAHDPEFFDSNGQYRGWKRDVYDGGIKTPFIARWAGTIAPGQENDSHFGDFADFLPTVAELAGAEIPIGIDGESYAHVLTGTTDETDFQRDFQYFE